MIEHAFSLSRLSPSVVETLLRDDSGKSPSMSKLSMNEMTTYRWSLLEDVTAYREAGIGSIGVWRPKLTEFGEERGVELLRDSGLGVSSLSWAGGFTGSNGHSFAEAVDDARDSLRVASEMNAQCLVIISGARCGHTLNHARRLLVDALKRLGDFAAECDVPLALQPMHAMFSREWTFLTTLDESLEIIDRIDHPYIRLAFDVYHLWQEPRLLERIPEIAPLTSVVQLSDWQEPPRSENDRALPGDGQIPLGEITRALVDAGYQGDFEIEVWSEDLWGTDHAELVKDCCDRFDSVCRS